MADVGNRNTCVYSLSEATMNTSEGSSVSRLAQMQARFQQKQLQEKEQKLLSLYQEQAHKAYQSINTGGGKVRQLFKERRGHQTGWDRSYPLEPLQDNRRGTSLDRSQNDISKQVRQAKNQARKLSQEEDDIDLQTIRNNNEYESGALDTLLKLHGRASVDENESPSRTNDLDPTRVFRKLPNIGASTLSEDNSDRYKTYVANKPSTQFSTMAPTNLQEVKKFPAHNRVSDVSSLTKTMSKLSTSSKKPETKAVNSTPAAPRSKASTPTSASTSRRPTPSPTTVSRPTASSNAQDRVNNMASSRAVKSNIQGTMSNPVRTPAAAPSARRAGPPAAASSTARNDLAPCKNCGRHFAPDRIDAHQDICLKTSKKKRKVFDPVKQRLKGTEAETYLRKGKLPATPPPPKTNWRRKHEDFIANIRAAKVAQAHVAKGGKLSDLPPPPPMDTSDLIPCPHCGRKFNDAAAARHIPKCATMLHNKPKPGAAANKGSVLRKR